MEVGTSAGDYLEIDVSAPYRVMLLSPTATLPEGEGWLFQMKLDGWRWLAQVIDGRVRMWSRGGHDWAARLPEMESLTALGDVVLDGELVVTSPDGRADFESLGARMQDRRRRPSPAVTLYAFDVLSVAGEELVDKPLDVRRTVLEGLDLASRTGASVRPTVWSTDGQAIPEHTDDRPDARPVVSFVDPDRPDDDRAALQPTPPVSRLRPSRGSH